jgi:hypothetical protein
MRSDGCGSIGAPYAICCWHAWLLYGHNIRSQRMLLVCAAAVPAMALRSSCNCIVYRCPRFLLKYLAMLSSWQAAATTVVDAELSTGFMALPWRGFI